MREWYQEYIRLNFFSQVRPRIFSSPDCRGRPRTIRAVLATARGGQPACSLAATISSIPHPLHLQSIADLEATPHDATSAPSDQDLSATSPQHASPPPTEVSDLAVADPTDEVTILHSQAGPSMTEAAAVVDSEVATPAIGEVATSGLSPAPPLISASSPP